MPKDGEVIIPVDGDVPQESPEDENQGEDSMPAPEMPESDLSLFKAHLFNNSQRQEDNQVTISKAQDYSYLTGKDSLTQAGAMAMRYLQGPHPQFGTPDAKAG